jgi:hypothetical protein
MFKIFLTLFLYCKFNRIQLINHLCLDDYIPKNNGMPDDDNIPKRTNNIRFSNLILLNTNKTEIRSNKLGYDERFNDIEVNDLKKITINYNKYKLLNILEDNDINIYNKLDIINNDDDLNTINKDLSYNPIKIKNGGLLNDWYIDFNYD